MAGRVQDEQPGLATMENGLPENCVEYFIFLIESETRNDTRKQLSRLEHIRKAALQLTTRLTSDYIWQRGSLNLDIVTNQGLVYLHGVSDYGDAIEDEWLLVYILRELSKSNPAAWIRVSDSDGEFLLVEAANVLPKWLSPENDQHRVWINNGHLRIIPLTESSPASKSQQLTLAGAVDAIREDAASLIHSEFIEAEAFYRLEKYPEQIQKSIHHSLVTIPRRLAYIIHQAPRAIAPAVESFYLRDALDLKALLSKPDAILFPPKDLVTLSVKFTRVLFAQLRSQRFEPPTPWVDIIQRARGKEQARLEMGMKVTCGFEIMLKNIHKTNSREAREASIFVEDLQEDGDSVLPTDKDINTWTDADRDDDEAWMDINYEDFEEELQGRRGGKGKQPGSGFGDSTAQADLRKIVSRFEAFLNDDSAGLEGVEIDEMDIDNEDDGDDDGSGEDDEDEDKAVSFDEAEFSRMMREMMGLAPTGIQATTRSDKKPGMAVPNATGLVQVGESGEDSDGEELQKLAAQLEAELKEYGALKLDAGGNKMPAVEGNGSSKDVGNANSSHPNGSGADHIDDEEGVDEEIDIDYNLAKNLLESFKGQAGLPGPAGNILSMMGLQLPRDEDDGDVKAGKEN
ncbi:regulatory factor sgt1 [Colletotrichum karsti]|uniref:Regulatory factor sgt1 n=1 Tax=Colletotrichum karsti TaxID=1095194 RepID=A0A9P6HSJ8_9PEZI|nr:regulatory factor sgt1 [Colletotrichum karsti]KAF9869254.1 regulatory factor sgt1 [Colletotrichum karsti]